MFLKSSVASEKQKWVGGDGVKGNAVPLLLVLLDFEPSDCATHKIDAIKICEKETFPLGSQGLPALGAACVTTREQVRGVWGHGVSQQVLCQNLVLHYLTFMFSKCVPISSLVTSVILVC